MALSGPAAALLGGGLDLAGGLFSNAKNIDLSREQMRFQERMASTQYQRAAQDLEKAGLNRILALGSPAAAPAGARPNITNPSAGLASSAKNLGLLQAQQKLLDEQAGQAKALKEKTIQEHDNLEQTEVTLRANAEMDQMRAKIARENPTLFMLQQFSSPTAAGASTAKSLMDLIMKNITRFSIKK